MLCTTGLKADIFVLKLYGEELLAHSSVLVKYQDVRPGNGRGGACLRWSLDCLICRSKHACRVRVWFSWAWFHSYTEAVGAHDDLLTSNKWGKTLLRIKTFPSVVFCHLFSSWVFVSYCGQIIV